MRDYPVCLGMNPENSRKVTPGGTGHHSGMAAANIL